MFSRFSVCMKPGPQKVPALQKVKTDPVRLATKWHRNVSVHLCKIGGAGGLVRFQLTSYYETESLNFFFKFYECTCNN